MKIKYKSSTIDNNDQSKKIPALPAMPFLGNVLALRRERLDLLLRIAREFGDIGAFHFGPRLVPVLNSPELVHKVLVEQNATFEKTATVRMLAAPILGDSLFLSEGEEHHKKRKVLAPLFQHRRVLDYATAIVNETVRLQATWNEGETINIADEMMRLTLSVMSNVLFGATVAGEERELSEALITVFHHFSDMMTNPLRPPQSWPTPYNRRARQALARVDATIYRLITARRKQHEEHNDLLSLLLQAVDEEHNCLLSDRQVRDEALSLFIAGHETTASALTWCWYLLSQHPEIYAKMQAEGDHVLAGRSPTIADLPNLPYTLQVFKETLRLYPPAYAFTRKAMSSVQLGAYHIPKGSSVVISPYALHRRACFFTNPEQFDPERFTPEQERQLPRYAYIPFGAGPHICLGMHFASLEGHLVLATLAQRLHFTFTGDTSLKAEPFITLQPKGAVPMRIQRR